MFEPQPLPPEAAGPTLMRTGADPELLLVEPTTGIPRYWATVWTLSLKGRSRSRNTTTAQLRQLEAFYRHCDTHFGVHSLDDATATRDAAALQAMTESFHAALTNSPHINTSTAQRWGVAQAFIRFTAKRLAISCDDWRALLGYLDGMGGIRPSGYGAFRFLRALPTKTLNDIVEIAAPSSPRNPVKSEIHQWRNWLIVQLYLVCGLRRGEALLLAVDSLKHDVDTSSGEFVYWLNVTTSEEEDFRWSQPSIKTTESHRQIPISPTVAALYEHYVNHIRSRSSEHGFLLSSQQGRALSAESVDKLFTQLTDGLTSEARRAFEIRTGGKRRVSPHDLRHTCATAAYAAFMAVEPNRELTLQRMRALFGWSIKSEMPEHYARAAIQQDLMRSWNKLFDDQVHQLRRLSR